jgi:hypothetical protein
VKFKEFIGDFIKDENGTWWFINCKGFLFDGELEYVDITPITMYGEVQIEEKPF